MSTSWLVLLGMVSGAGAGLLAGLIGIGGGIVIVPVVFYGLVETGTSADQAAHVAVATRWPLSCRLNSYLRWHTGGLGTLTSASCETGDPASVPGLLSRNSQRHMCAAA